MSGLPDIHSEPPSLRAPIERVGIVSIRVPIGYLSFEGRPVMVIPSFDVFIDLPTDLKGMHASRNYEAVMVVMEGLGEKEYRLEDVCAKIARDLLIRHEYAKRAEVYAKAEAVIGRSSPVSRARSYETFDIYASARCERDGSAIKVVRSIGVGVIGMTVCPCAQELVRDAISREIGGSAIPTWIPVGSHMQRAYGMLITELPEGYEMDAKRLYDIVEGAMSSSTYGLLKRVDEAKLVRDALSNPRFAEDCIRQMMKGFAKEFPDLDDRVNIRFYVRSEESIHKHDFVAESVCKLGDIRAILNG